MAFPKAESAINSTRTKGNGKALATAAVEVQKGHPVPTFLAFGACRRDRAFCLDRRSDQRLALPLGLGSINR